MKKATFRKFFRFYLLSVPLFVYLIATGVVKSGNDCIFGNRNQTFNWKSFHCVSWYLGNGRKKLVGLIGKVSVYGKLFSGKRFLWKSIKEGRLERRLEARMTNPSLGKGKIESDGWQESTMEIYVHHLFHWWFHVSISSFEWWFMVEWRGKKNKSLQSSLSFPTVWKNKNFTITRKYFVKAIDTMI